MYNNVSNPDLLDEDPTDEEIREYAVQIGINPEKEPELLWIAHEGITAPIPADWKPVQQENGDIYFFNSKSSQSIWEHPSDDKFRDKVKEERKKLHLVAKLNNPRPNSALTKSSAALQEPNKQLRPLSVDNVPKVLPTHKLAPLAPLAPGSKPMSKNIAPLAAIAGKTTQIESIGTKYVEKKQPIDLELGDNSAVAQSNIPKATPAAAQMQQALQRPKTSRGSGAQQKHPVKSPEPIVGGGARFLKTSVPATQATGQISSKEKKDGKVLQVHRNANASGNLSRALSLNSSSITSEIDDVSQSSAENSDALPVDAVMNKMRPMYMPAQTTTVQPNSSKSLATANETKHVPVSKVEQPVAVKQQPNSTGMGLKEQMEIAELKREQDRKVKELQDQLQMERKHQNEQVKQLNQSLQHALQQNELKLEEVRQKFEAERRVLETDYKHQLDHMQIRLAGAESKHKDTANGSAADIGNLKIAHLGEIETLKKQFEQQLAAESQATEVITVTEDKEKKGNAGQASEGSHTDVNAPAAASVQFNAKQERQQIRSHFVSLLDEVMSENVATLTQRLQQQSLSEESNADEFDLISRVRRFLGKQSHLRRNLERRQRQRAAKKSEEFGMIEERFWSKVDSKQRGAEQTEDEDELSSESASDAELYKLSSSRGYQSSAGVAHLHNSLRSFGRGVDRMIGEMAVHPAGRQQAQRWSKPAVLAARAEDSSCQLEQLKRWLREFEDRRQAEQSSFAWMQRSMLQL